MDTQKTKIKTKIVKGIMTTTNSSTIKVQKRDGRLEPLDINKIHFVVEEACEDLPGVSASQIEMNANIQVYDGMTTKDIQNVLVRSANDLISLETPNYQYAAARLLSYDVRKEAHGQYEYTPLLKLILRNIRSGVYDKSILEKYTKTEIKSMKESNEFNKKSSEFRKYIEDKANVSEKEEKKKDLNTRTKEQEDWLTYLKTNINVNHYYKIIMIDNLNVIEKTKEEVDKILDNKTNEKRIKIDFAYIGISQRVYLKRDSFILGNNKKNFLKIMGFNFKIVGIWPANVSAPASNIPKGAAYAFKPASIASL